ncbi:metal-dependent hydrolase [Rhodopirellula sp. MGV]|uniref:metal-dependent hydrolase n=1 Tax=Rhodopirellula sp. MGV TaxID=2023130 RepID=UPI000B965FC8|nr:metal-dependent hydrolase [Rhodopirellula sp. MGV]OYP29836.1 metal-dependent hydrolase [Rhodopirellula sp. MGV]PNY33717.1 metal-dependent hydrolase [Rhodopirellula baltica]
MIKLTWLSHASWYIETKSMRILLDPFFTDNPAAQVSADDFADCTHVLVSHGHFDHVGDVAPVAAKSGAQIITNFEIAQWFQEKHDLSNVLGMNIGGQIDLPDGTLKMVPAIHSSMLPDGSNGGSPAGFVLKLGDRSVYFACDTAFFSDMRWYAKSVDIVVLPIGDLYTMGIRDSLEAIKIIEPKIALPTHYGTWPPIEQNAAHWAAAVRAETDAMGIALEVGETFEV